MKRTLLIVGMVVGAIFFYIVGYSAGGPTKALPDNGTSQEVAPNDTAAIVHCLDPQDWNHRELIPLIKTQLRYPDSMEEIKTRGLAPSIYGSGKIAVNFRAKNMKGEMAYHEATATVNPDNCQAQLESVTDIDAHFDALFKR